MAANAPVEEARRRGVPEDFIEKHKYTHKFYKGPRVRDLFEQFVKKGETVKLNEVTLHGVGCPMRKGGEQN